MDGNMEIYAVTIGVESSQDFLPVEEGRPASGFRPVLKAIELNTDWEEATDFEPNPTSTTDRYALFYRPLVERLLGLDIRPLPTIYGGFTGRWRSFSTGYERRGVRTANWNQWVGPANSGVP